MPDPNQGEYWHFWPQILPGGKVVLFTNVGRGIEIYSLETGERKLLFKGGTYARYVPTGHIIYARKETLYAVAFDIEQLKVIGTGVPVVPDVITSVPRSGSAQFAISRDGTLAYVPVQARSAERRPVWVDRGGRVEPLPAGVAPGNYWDVTISPDGSQAAFSIADGENLGIWIYDLMRHTLSPLTSDGLSFAPNWAPDSKSLIFRSRGQLYEQSADGSGERELLVEVWGNMTSCSSDGKELLITTSDSRLESGICVLPLEGSGKGQPRPFIQRNNRQREGVWSPDGRWVAYASDETRWWEVYVEPYPGPGPKIRISTEGGRQPGWSQDGKELFYRSAYGDRMTAARIETEPEFRVTGYKELFEGRYFALGDGRRYDVAPDGRFLMIQELGESTPSCIHVVLNWFEELKRLVPPGKN